MGEIAAAEVEVEGGEALSALFHRHNCGARVAWLGWRGEFSTGLQISRVWICGRFKLCHVFQGILVEKRIIIHVRLNCSFSFFPRKNIYLSIDSF